MANNPADMPPTGFPAISIVEVGKPKSSMQPLNSKEDLLKAVDDLAMSQSWGYSDRDLLCRVLRRIVETSK